MGNTPNEDMPIEPGAAVAGRDGAVRGRSSPGARRPVARAALLGLALATLLGHLAIAGRYGWFRDELYYIDAGKHLAGGYVEFPMLVALLAAFQRATFGHSLAALHVLPAVAGALAVFATGLMARELGGGRTAQGIAALAVAVAPAFVAADALFTMDAFDQVWWTLAALVLLRLLGMRDPRPAEQATPGRHAGHLCCCSGWWPGWAC